MAKEVYGQAFQTSTDKDLYTHRAILTPTNDEKDKINDYMLSQLPGEEKVYLSSDSIIPSDVDIEENVVYPAEFLNSVKVAGLPRHCLKLKVGAPIMCLRNMDVADGLCNGTRLIVTQLLPHVIEGLNRTTKDQRRAETNGRGTAPIGSRCRELSRACFFSRTVASGLGFGLRWTQAELRLRTLITDRERLKLSLIGVELDRSLQARTQARTI
ncbi:uncharacterized protein LOC125592504 [Brassica napus]|uniref:uncharacterized protein LOC125592504 n=1 Tax=Brassica napus TaxID=3708 RepID=UPI00207A6A49|nr:uncharacterized protein LOC125592504 [Brassica napus]